MKKIEIEDTVAHQIIQPGLYQELVSVEGIKNMANKINEIIEWINEQKKAGL